MIDLRNNNKLTQFSPQDVIAAIGFEAQRIANSIAQHSAGAPMPDPTAMQVVIDRMSELNVALVRVVGVARAANQDDAAKFITN